MDIRARRSRETSPDRARVSIQPKTTIRSFKKVQIVYYLCRNGQLEHPHFMELSHLPNQQLRLKDVIDRLTILRGRGMPSLFSWSCKRSYKNGYVWNDLAENDAIYPADGAEYVLKGSELIEGCADRFQQLHLSSSRQLNPEANFLPKRKFLVGNQTRVEVDDMGMDNEEEKGSNSSSNTPNSRCSRGVSTEEIEANEQPKNHNNATEISLDDDGSPPSSSSTISDKTNNGTSQRFDDSDSGAEPPMTRNSVLLQLIACGSVTTAKGRSLPLIKPSNVPIARKSSSLHKGVLCKSVAKSAIDEDEINYMSENPRFGNLQSEEKEFFSGSIVESMTENRVAEEPSLKKSSSYNEERSLKSGIAEEGLEERETEKRPKGGCIPRKISACSSKPHKK